MTEPSVTYDDIRKAEARIQKHIRLTPIIEASPTKNSIACKRLTLKLECLQVTGSFKPRGAISRLTLLDKSARAQGLVTASGGNHGLGVAYAGRTAGIPVTVIVPRGTPAGKSPRSKPGTRGLLPKARSGTTPMPRRCKWRHSPA